MIRVVNGMSEREADRLGRRARSRLRWWRPIDDGQRLISAALDGDMTAVRAAARHVPIRLHTAWHVLFRRNDLDTGLPTHLVTAIALNPDPAELTEDMRPVLVAAAAFSGHPVAAIAQRKIAHAGDRDLVEGVCELAATRPDLAEFCRAHGYTPADPTRRARFSLLTGQREAYRDADRGGSLVDRHYQSADVAERRRLRTAAIDIGDIELVFRLSGIGGADELVCGGELDHLTKRLVADRDWPNLWRTIRSVAPADGVRLVRELPPDWLPDRNPGLCAELRSIPLLEPVETPALIAISDDQTWGAVSICPDTDRVAFAYRIPAGRRIVVLSLPDGVAADETDYDIPSVGQLALCADGSVVATRGVGEDSGLWRLAGGRSELLDDSIVFHLRSVTGGWAAVTGQHLVIGSADGRIERRISLPDLGPLAALTASTDGRVFALAGLTGVALIGRDGGSGVHRVSTVDGLAFLGDDVLIGAVRRRSVTTDRWYEYYLDGVDLVVTRERTSPHAEMQESADVRESWDLVRWRVGDGRTLVPEGSRMVWHYHEQTRPSLVTPEMGRLALHVDAALRRIVLTGKTREFGPVEWHFHDVTTLERGSSAEPGCPDRLHTWPSFAASGSPYCAYLDKSGRGRVYDLHRAQALALLDKPFVAFGPADFHVVFSLSRYWDDSGLRAVRAYCAFDSKGQRSVSGRLV